MDPFDEFEESDAEESFESESDDDEFESEELDVDVRLRLARRLGGLRVILEWEYFLSCCLELEEWLTLSVLLRGFFFADIKVFVELLLVLKSGILSTIMYNRI
ncbi:unnamed protein product [Schistosoma mattheei]|uniref:Uncharacterized protein n=1 Tax=Schistosoma mattheei TaxID=31246 RepID=A0A3P8FBS6_9TREM|nr:unnamed protein product [Schistosoma mattheei]